MLDLIIYNFICYMYTCIQIHLNILDIELYMFVKRLIKYQIIIYNLLII